MEERFHLLTIDPQLRVAENCILAEGREKLQREFADYLTRVMRHKNPDALLIVLDGLDDLPEPSPTEPSVVDLLPPPEMLPEACFVLLAGHDDLRPRVRQALEQLRAASSEETWTSLRLDPADADSEVGRANQALLRSYLDRELPARLRTAEAVDAVLRLSGGVFLYEAHYCRLLERGAFSDVGELPPPDRLYAEYLARLEERVGAEAFGEVYQPLLLTLAAAQVPVTLEMLQDGCLGRSGCRLRWRTWGISCASTGGVASTRGRATTASRGMRLLTRRFCALSRRTRRCGKDCGGSTR
jgi:hypothetical protein